MSTAIWLFISITILIAIITGHYFFIERPKLLAKMNSNVIRLQSDGVDYILYTGKVTELISEYHRYIAKMDVVVYSKSLFIGFLEPRKAYMEIPAKAIETVKYNPNKIIISCSEQLAGTKKIIIKGNSTKELYLLSKKIDFISRRSKKVSAF